MNTSSNLSLAGKLSIISILSSANPVEILSQTIRPSAYVFCMQNDVIDVKQTDTASIDFSEIMIPKKSFVARYKRISESLEFKSAYEGRSLGERILVE